MRGFSKIGLVALSINLLLVAPCLSMDSVSMNSDDEED